MTATNIDFDNSSVPESIFRVTCDDEEIDVFRWNRHCIRKQLHNEIRWCSFAIPFKIQKHNKYRLSIEVKSTYPMRRSFFISVKSSLEVPDCALPEDEWVSKTIEFYGPETGKGFVVITANDIPVAGHHIFIRKLIVEEIT